MRSIYENSIEYIVYRKKELSYEIASPEFIRFAMTKADEIATSFREGFAMTEVDEIATTNYVSLAMTEADEIASGLCPSQ